MSGLANYANIVVDRQTHVEPEIQFANRARGIPALLAAVSFSTFIASRQEKKSTGSFNA
jgi:hypothetical protein